MTSAVTVVDHGAGNLLSVCRALAYCGADVRVAETAEAIEGAERLVVPGVGAFADAMRCLRDRRLIEPITRYYDRSRPFLGICVGMQVMMECGEEFGTHPGLGLVDGVVKAIPATDADGRSRKIPHVGWSRISAAAGANGWRDTILDQLEDGSFVYFVHSFAAWPAQAADRLADAQYEGCTISAVIRRGLAYGCQFHPEKSGPVGLRILENFLRL